MAEETIPVFNLKAVVRATGVAAPTLRAWERRYGLPRPQRAPSGRRLYSRQDAETIHWLVARQAEGMTIGQAVALWRSLEEAGKDPLVEYPRRPAKHPPAEQEALERWRDAWIAACLAFDESAADAAFGQALAMFPPEVVCTEVLLEGLSWIGEAWYRGAATVHQEHFASYLAARWIQAPLASAPPISRPDLVMVICPPGERHAFGPLLLTYLLRRAGWGIVYLGADTPVAEMRATVQRSAPRWVIATAHHLPPVVGVQALGTLLEDMGVPLAFGGRIFNQVPTLRSRIRGYFLGEQIREVPMRLEEWAVRLPPLPPLVPIPDAYRQAQIRYVDQEPFIRARVFALLAYPPTHDLPQWLIDYTFAHIRAALMLGDMALADAYVDWLRGLQGGLSLSPGWVTPFLEAYQKGIEHYLGQDGAPLLEWLSQQMKVQPTGGNL